MISLAVISCNKPDKTYEKQRIQQLEQEKAQLVAEKKAEEKAKQIAIEDSRRWKIYTIVAIGIGALFLFIGAGLGSAARKDAINLRKSKSKQDHRDDEQAG
jgi:hypothetical protein